MIGKAFSWSLRSYDILINKQLHLRQSFRPDCPHVQWPLPACDHIPSVQAMFWDQHDWGSDSPLWWVLKVGGYVHQTQGSRRTSSAGVWIGNFPSQQFPRILLSPSVHWLRSEWASLSSLVHCMSLMEYQLSPACSVKAVTTYNWISIGSPARQVTTNGEQAGFSERDVSPQGLAVL